MMTTRTDGVAATPGTIAALPMHDQRHRLPFDRARERLRAERVALNARMIEAALLRLMPLLPAAQVELYGLAAGRRTIAELASQYEAEGRTGR